MEGGQSITVNPALDQVPVYVRAGAIVPHQPIVQNVEQLPDGPLELRVYPGPNCRGSLYLDDGNTFDYTRGAYLRSSFTCEALPASVRVHIDPGMGDYKPWWHQIRVMVMGGASRPHDVTLNGNRVAGWNYVDNIVSVPVPVSSKPLDVFVTYK
jgi:alpha-glucosidase